MPITKEDLIYRRNKIIEKMNDDSLLILFAGVSKIRSEDEDYPFSINRNFYYLTNIDQEESILLIRKSEGIIKETLLLSTYNPIIEKWTGKRLTIQEGKELSSIDNCLFLDQAENLVKEYLSDESLTVYLDFSKNYDYEKNKNVDYLINLLKEKYPSLVLQDIYPDIIRLRMKKSASEIEDLKVAINNTKNAIEVLLNNIEKDKNEYELSSLFYHTIHSFKASELSFPSICASGKNATCLHYTTSLDSLKKDDLVLFDLGARNNYLCADISRTFPVSKKFSGLNKKIYEIVLAANKLVIEKARPGLTLMDLQEMTSNFLAKECVKAKLIEKEEDIKNVYFHSVSHFIGLDTHDPAFLETDTTTKTKMIPLEEGNVISDEPGLYFEKLGIGVRIEDDLLITKDGAINLSSSIIKEVDDIEEFLKRRK